MFGAESETTREPAKFQGTHKLHRVRFKNDWAMVGESGVAHLSSMAINTLKRLAADTDVTHGDVIRKTAGKAFREIVSELNCPRLGTRKCQEFFRQDTNYFELTIGYYFCGNPHLYVLNPVFGAAASPNREFCVSGIAGYLAEYLLKEFRLPELDSIGAITTAGYVVGEVKTAVMGCGGSTEIMLVSAGSRPEIVDKSFMGMLEKRLNEFAVATRNHRMDAFKKMLESHPLAYLPVLDGTIE